MRGGKSPEPSARVQQLMKTSSIVLALSATVVGQSLLRGQPVLVQYVVDGDTIAVAGIGRVRLLGIDAPEVGRGFDTSGPFAEEARQRLSSLVARRWVRLEFESHTPRDKYERHLAYVFLETGTFVNALLVREGLARSSVRSPLARRGELQRAQAEAQAARRGMWGALPSLPMERYVVPRQRRQDGSRE
jgi:endonuclease YncB( thermonuclease family)